MFSARVYDVFIASPSDVREERTLLETEIHEWNVLNSRNKNTILRPVKWESNVYSDFLSPSPQAAINDQILETADILIAVFWSRIGTPTAEHESGTVEEFRKHIERDRPALVFFSKENLPQDFDEEQFGRLKEFKTWCKSKGVFFEYSAKAEFKDLARRQLSLLLNSDRYRANTLEIEQKIAGNEYSKRKRDAIAFVQNIAAFNANQNLVSQFLDELGDYRSLRLENFFQETGLLGIAQTSGGLVISLSARMWNMTEKDVQELLEDVKTGEYDHVL